MQRPLTVSRLLAVAIASAVPAAMALAPTTAAAGAAPSTAPHAPPHEVAAPHPASPGRAPHSATLPAPALSGGVSAAAGIAHPTPGRTVRTAVPMTTGASASITITGHGFGHGRGMGQWGAFGYASESAYDWTYRQIVAHYYGGTTLEPAPSTVENTPVSVNLSELDGASATTVRPHRSGAELTVDGGPARSGTITVDHTGAAQTIRATAGDVSVELPGVGWRTYQGYIEIRATSAPDGEAGQTWNVVPLEDYVGGVVPGESPSYWGEEGGEAALQAQAVAVRSYALAYVVQVGRTCDTSSCQEYVGDPSTQGLGSEATYPSEATSTTRSQVMCTSAISPCPTSDIAFTEFSSSSGGWTAGGAFPSVVDAGDAVAGNTNHDWSVSVPLATLEADYPGAGRLTSVLVTQRNGHGAWGGRAVTVQLRGTGGTVTDTGEDVAARLGLLSDWFRFATQPPA